jgi:hypothetical protein
VIVHCTCSVKLYDALLLVREIGSCDAWSKQTLGMKPPIVCRKAEPRAWVERAEPPSVGRIIFKAKPPSVGRMTFKVKPRSVGRMIFKAKPLSVGQMIIKAKPLSVGQYERQLRM